MERILHRDDFVGVCSTAVFGVFPCQLNCRLICFGTAIAEEGLIHVGIVDKQFREFCLRLDIVEIGGM